MVQPALLAGCRNGELVGAQVREFDSRSSVLLIADSKSGKARRVPLTDAGVELLEAICAGRSHNALMFPRANGTPSYSMAIGRCIEAACKDAEIEPPATFYTLRHTYASHLVQQGTPLLIVAEVMGHRDTRMVEKHYAHLAPSHVAMAIRRNLPQFGIEAQR